MSNNAQKTHYVQSINRFAEKKALDAIEVLGKSLPCHVVAVSGSIVTVKFDVNSVFTLPDVTCPMMGPEYIRYPTQVGDLGIVVSADYYIGGVSGLGGGVANLSLRANLSALVFIPIANTGKDTTKNWPPTDDPNALVLYGPDGVIIRTIDKKSVITVGETSVVIKVGDNTTVTVGTDSVVISQGGDTLTIDSSNVRTSGVLQAGNGATGTILTATVQTIQVRNGIVTSIS